jgi:hypothetical protein
MTSATLAASRSNRLTWAVLACLVAAAIPVAGGSGTFMPAMALGCWFLVLSALDRPQIDRVWTGFIWVSVGAAICAYVQLPRLEYPFRPPGPFASPDYLGAFAAVMAFVCLRFGYRYLAVGNLVTVAVTQSRGALLAVGAGGAVWLWQRSRIAACVGIIAAIAAAILLWRPEARIGIWTLGLKIAAQHPLTGWGIRGVEVWPLNHFYSVPLDWLIATGIIGAAAGMWLAVTVWRLAGRDDRAILAAWVVAGLFLSASWPMWAVLFAVLAGLVSRDIPDDAGVIDDHEPLLNRGVRSLRPE